ncbi:MAG: GtrA family protein [Pseudomonadales bacterium]
MAEPSEAGTPGEYRGQVKRQLWRFLQVGAIGFGVDMSVLASLLYGLGWNQTTGQLLGTRLFAFLVAVSCTFVMHARYTFGASVRRANFTGYVLIQVLGAALSIGVYGILVLGPLRHAPLVSMTLGAMTATASNFLLSRRFVYRPR